MTRSTRTGSGLRRPLAVASVLALTSGVALGLAPSAGAAGNGGNGGAGGSYGGGIQYQRPIGYYPILGGSGGNGGVGGVGIAGNGGSGGTGPIACTDDNLDRLGRATGGEMHALEKEGVCLVVHRFTSDGTFRLTARPGFPMEVMVVSGGGGGGGGSGWADATKASGAEPDSGAGAGGAGGAISRGTLTLGVPNPSTGVVTGAAPFTDPAGRTLTYNYTPTSGVGATDQNGDPLTTTGGLGTFADVLSEANPWATQTTLVPDGSFIYTPTTGVVEGCTGEHVIDTACNSISVGVGSGGAGGLGGTSASGSTGGGQGGRGGTSSFGPITVVGGVGGFGGGGTGSGDLQTGWSADPRAGGQRGGSNSLQSGGVIFNGPGTPAHAAPGGAGAVGGGIAKGAVSSGIAGGGDGGVGATSYFWEPNATTYGCGGGGGTIDPGSPPYATVSGGAGGRGGLLSDAPDCAGDGGAGGDGGDAPDGLGGGGGGGGTDGSVTPGDSNAGAGGRGGDGVVYVRYAALAAPATPAAPLVTPGDGSATLTITPLDVPPDYYLLWVAGDPTKTCTILPPDTSCVIEGLDNGVDYTFLAFAGNSAGESDSSVESLVSAPGVLPYTGSGTRDLTAVALSLIGLGGGVTLLTRRRRSIID